MAMAKQLNTSYPKFAVVGHPNKGKSSIVASLANDDSVQISDTPGTTTKSRCFPFRIDDTIVYALFDTPGFQRARAVLTWLQKHHVPAHKRAEVVRSFIYEHRENPKYHDEIALLTPIMEGAGIIFVVDGSKPYGEEYEAEMEILRWTGQPSMALINHIDEEDYTQEWRRALEQYFRIVRSYDPMQTTIEQKISLLEAMAQLKEAWSAPVKHSIALFQEHQEQKLKQGAKTITHLIRSALSHVQRSRIKEQEPSSAQKEAALQSYQNQLREMEYRSQQLAAQIWNHHNLKTEQEELPLEGMDLFSKKSASIFGLTKEEMVTTGITGGAITGAGVDLLFAGHTLLLGGMIGAAVGGVGAYLGFDQISEVKVLGKTLGNRYLETGPMKNRNFPYILLGRALYHLSLLAKRSHAERDAAVIIMDSSFKEKWLDEKMRKSLEKLHKKFRSGDAVKKEESEAYEALVLEALKKVL